MDTSYTQMISRRAFCTQSAFIFMLHTECHVSCTHSIRWTTHRYTFPYLWINRCITICILALCQGVAKGKGKHSGWFTGILCNYLNFDTLILGTLPWWAARTVKQNTCSVGGSISAGIGTGFVIHNGSGIDSQVHCHCLHTQSSLKQITIERDEVWGFTNNACALD